MKSLVQEERLTALIKSSLNLMCKTSLHYDSEVEIKGLLGITLDKKNVFLVDVKEIITLGDNNEHSDLELGEDVEDFEEIDSTYTPPTTTKRNSSARNTRALKRDRRSIKDHEGVGGEDEPKRKKRTGKGYAADGDNEEKQQGETGDLDFCVVKVEKQEDEDTDLNTSDALGLSNDAADNSQKTDDFPNDDYDNGGNEDSDNEVDESTTENTQSTSSKERTIEKTTNEKSDLKKKEREETKPFLCEQCPKSFNTNPAKISAIDTSFEVNENVDQYLQKSMLCGVCGMFYKSLTGLRWHINTVHKPNKGHRCSTCRHICATRSSLMTHMKKHSQVKSYTCSSCHTKFTYKCGLKQHSAVCRASAVAKPKYPCDLCEKTFSRKSSIPRHLQQQHADHKEQFSCICGKRYPYKTSLERHLKSCVHKLQERTKTTHEDKEHNST